MKTLTITGSVICTVRRQFYVGELSVKNLKCTGNLRRGDDLKLKIKNLELRIFSLRRKGCLVREKIFIDRRNFRLNGTHSFRRDDVRCYESC